SSGGQFLARPTRSMKSPPSPVAKSYPRPSLLIVNDPVCESARRGDSVLYSSPSHRELLHPNIRSIRKAVTTCRAKLKVSLLMGAGFSAFQREPSASSGTLVSPGHRIGRVFPREGAVCVVATPTFSDFEA